VKTTSLCAVIFAVVILSLLLSGCDSAAPPRPGDVIDAPGEPTKVPIPSPIAPESVRVRIFSVSTDETHLVVRETTMSPEQYASIAHSLEQAVPQAITNVSLVEGRAILSLSSEALAHQGAKQLLYLYALVNTACARDDVEVVTFEWDEPNDFTVPLRTPYEEDLRYIAPDWWKIGFDHSPDLRVQEIPMPPYFRLVSWKDQQTIVGIAGDALGHFNLLEETFEPWGMRAWNALVSADGSWTAYTDEDGIAVRSAGTGDIVRIGRPPGVEEHAEVIAWAPDSRRLLVHVQQEVQGLFYLHDLNTSTWERLALSLDGYIISPQVHWIDEDRFVMPARAIRSVNGDLQYREGGFRADVLRYSVSSGARELLTEVDDGTFIQILDVQGEDLWVLAKADGKTGSILRLSTEDGRPRGESFGAHYMDGFGDGRNQIVGIEGSPFWGPFSWFTVARINKDGPVPTQHVRVFRSPEPDTAVWSPDGTQLLIGYRATDYQDLEYAHQAPEVMRTIVITWPGD